MAEAHEQAWAEALAEEHAHQRELLATLRDELGTFARECAAALTALDAYVGLAGVGEILSTARTGVQHASLVLEVGRRLPGLARTPHDEQTEELYDRLGGDGDVPQPLVRHAGELLRAGPSGATASSCRPSSARPAPARRSRRSSAPPR